VEIEQERRREYKNIYPPPPEKINSYFYVCVNVYVVSMDVSYPRICTLTLSYIQFQGDVQKLVSVCNMHAQTKLFTFTIHLVKSIQCFLYLTMSKYAVY